MDYTTYIEYRNVIITVYEACGGGYRSTAFGRTSPIMRSKRAAVADAKVHIDKMLHLNAQSKYNRGINLNIVV